MIQQQAKKCRQCLNRSQIEFDGMAVCYKTGHNVWLESVACKDIDDIPVF